MRRAARLPAGRERAHHVRPCARRRGWRSASICSSRVASAVALVWRHPLAEIAAQAAAPIGAAFTLVCLATGSLWGRPMWGAWWVWDARLTSVLVLFFLYLGYIALVNAFDDPSRGAQGRLGPGAGRGGQPADHQILGRLVEHAAPAGERPAARRPDHRHLDAGPAAGHGGGIHAAVLSAADAAHAHRAQRAQGVALAPQRRCGAGVAPAASPAVRRARPACAVRAAMSAVADCLAMGGYAAFVWPAYGVAARWSSAASRSISWRRLPRRARAALDAAAAGTRDASDDPQAAAASASWRSGMAALGGGHRAGADRVQRQSRVLLQPERAAKRKAIGRTAASGIGGLVEEKALSHEADGRTVAFRVTDGTTDLAVVYHGVLPDLFREGQGVVAEGRLRPTASSPPATCWPSTTRNTCRARSSTR